MARSRHERLRRLGDARLYFVCEGLPHGRDPTPLLEAALRGGADILQLREKAPRCAEELVSLAEPFRRAAAAHGALFMLNDRPDLVEACGADGVHVGQDDAPVAEARARRRPRRDRRAVDPLGEAAARGAAPPRARRARTRSASGRCGTPRPRRAGRPPAWASWSSAAHEATIPWFAIGGIDTGNVAEVADAGAERVVVVRAIRDAEDPEAAARALRAALPERVGVS